MSITISVVWIPWLVTAACAWQIARPWMRRVDPWVYGAAYGADLEALLALLWLVPISIAWAVYFAVSP